MAKCQKCGNLIDNKLKAAIASNNCPFCGYEIYNKIEFAYRKRILEILQNYDIDLEKITFIIDDICAVTNGDAKQSLPTVFKKEGNSLNGVVFGQNDEVIEDDVKETEEEKEVREMIESGEIAMMNQPSERKIPIGKTKKPPIPINRLS